MRAIPRPVRALAQLLLILVSERDTREASASALDHRERRDPVDAKSLIDAMCKERGELRGEIILMETSMHRAVFLFVSVAAAFGGIYWDNRVVPDGETKAKLLLALSQLEWFLALFLLALVGNRNAHVGYLRALEGQMNKLAGRPLALWDSVASRRFLFSPRSAFFWIQATILTVLASLFGLTLYMAVRLMGYVWLYGLGALEATVTLALSAWILWQIERIPQDLSQAFDGETEGG